jgi:2,5-diamino-6-(ribosylamino)-4(3H)-pyrimidinone 5'-phosphate reductase
MRCSSPDKFQVPSFRFPGKLRSSVRVNPKPKTRTPKLPFVLVNMSLTADGKIATTNRAVAWFSSQRDQEHLHELRATTDAVMCGARTVDLNRVNLSPGRARFRKLRLRSGLTEYNLRIIVSGSGSINPDAYIFKRRAAGKKKNQDEGAIIILTTARAGNVRLKKLQAVADEVKVFGQKELDLRAALAWLRRQWNVRRLVCEGGGALNDAMFRAGLVDELHLTLCPHIIGGRTAPTIADGKGFSKLAGAARLSLRSIKPHGDELFLVYARI